MLQTVTVCATILSDIKYFGLLSLAFRKNLHRGDAIQRETLNITFAAFIISNYIKLGHVQNEYQFLNGPITSTQEEKNTGSGYKTES
jgi:hypothetical protein